MANNLDSVVLQGLDIPPLVIGTSGEGFKGDSMLNNDLIAIPANNAQFDVYRLCRFPTNVHMKHVFSYGIGIDSNAAALAAFDINVAFSDSLYDNTPPSLNGAIPTSANTGLVCTVTPGTGYVGGTPNRLFGAGIKLNANAGAKASAEQTYAGSFTPAAGMVPLWNYFGFVNLQSIPQDPGGMFDICLVQSANAATAAAGTAAIEVDFVL